MTEGVWNGLYKGTATTCVRAALLTGTQMSSYDHAKHTLLDRFSFPDDFRTHFWYRPTSPQNPIILHSFILLHIARGKKGL